MGQGPESWADQEEEGLGRLRCPLLFMTSSPPPVSLCHSLNHQKNLVELSFLPGDTGKPDLLSASLEGPLPKQEERKTEAEERYQKGEKKNQKRNEKKNQKGQEEVELPSKEKQQPQKPQAQKRGGRERRESGSEQVRSCRGLWLPVLLLEGQPRGHGDRAPAGAEGGCRLGLQEDAPRHSSTWPLRKE